MTYTIGRKDNKKAPKKTSYATKNSTPKVDLEAIKRQKAERDTKSPVLPKEPPQVATQELVLPPPPTFTPVILEAKHDTVGKTWSQWHQHLFKNNPLKTIPAERQHTFDPEVLSAIYRRIGEVVRKSVDSGTWNDVPKFKDMLSNVATKAIDCRTLNSSQLFPFLRAAVQIVQEELSVEVQDIFDTMKELEEAGDTASSDQIEEWIQFLLGEVAKGLLDGTQKYLYSTVSARWSYLTDDKGVAPTPLDRLELAYKFGTAKCTEENFAQQCLKDLAKCLGSIEPADWRWVESLENFRSRAWSLIEDERRKFAGIPDEEEVVATPFVDMSVSEEVRALREQSRKWRDEPVKHAPKPRPIPVKIETFGERALRIHYASKAVVLPDLIPTLELATTSTDKDVLEACVRSTNFEILTAVYNNPKTSFSTFEKLMSDERIMQLAVKQSEERAEATK